MKRYFEAPAKESWRRRFAPAVLVLGLLGALKLTYDATPREQAVQLHLTDDLRANVDGVKLTYLEDGEPVFGSEQRFYQGAPPILRSEPALAPGQYQLEIELSQRSGGVQHVRRDVTVPVDGALRIRLGE